MEELQHFPAALKAVLGIEGGKSNDPRDHGGATSFGISLAFAQQLAAHSPEWLKKLDVDGDGKVEAEDIFAITTETATLIYAREFWWKYSCHVLPHPAGLMFFSYVVNMDPTSAVRILQRAVNYVHGRKIILEDGLLGPKTRWGAQRCDAAELCKRLDACASEHYADLGQRQPYYEQGWQYRSADVLWAAALEFAKGNHD